MTYGEADMLFAWVFGLLVGIMVVLIAVAATMRGRR